MAPFVKSERNASVENQSLGAAQNTMPKGGNVKSRKF
jgi:hypothetical protein